MTTIFHMKPVTSSSVESVGFDHTTETLAIHFKGSGKTYHYQGVSHDLYERLRTAKSVGKFIGEHIRGKYPHQAHETA